MAQLLIRFDGDGALAELMPPGTDTPEDVQRLIAGGELIHLANDAEIIVSGLEGGMQSGAPSVCLGFKLPDGKVVMAETSWRLFATAFHALAGRFGTAYPDMQEMDILHSDGKGGPVTRTTMLSPDALQFAECEHCGERREFAPASEGQTPEAMYRWLHDHYVEKHPEVPAPWSER